MFLWLKYRDINSSKLYNIYQTCGALTYLKTRDKESLNKETVTLDLQDMKNVGSKLIPKISRIYL